MLPTLHIRLLGQFHLQAADQSITTLDTPRLQSLLAYLALHHEGAQSRQHLSYLFWPDSSEAQARTNLRKQLLFLRRALPDADAFLQIDNQSVQWQPQVELTVDVMQFEQMLAQGESVGDDKTLERLQKAENLYRGEFLAGCYDEWILAKREQLHTAYLETLEQLMLMLEGRRDYTSAIHFATRLQQQEPLHETTYRHLMRLYALDGNRAAALKTHHTLQDLLARELDVEPSVETQEAYGRLLRNETVAILRTASPSDPIAGPMAAPFVGRKSEWRILANRWQIVRRGQAHFVLVAGEPGIGKSRLLEEFRDWAVAQGIQIARSRCYAAEGRLAYAPLVEFLSAPAIRPRLGSLDDMWLVELARLLPDLGVDFSNLPQPEPVTAVWHRRHLFEALSRAILAVNEPLLLIVDDLQWCDQESLEWLHFFLRFTTQTPVLLAGTVRPAEVTRDHPLTTLVRSLRSNEQITEINLEPLTTEETTELAEQIGGHPFTSEEQTRFYQETEGNPLFVIETVRAGVWTQTRATVEQQPFARKTDDGMRTAVIAPSDIESEPAMRSPDLSILPAKVHAVIQARLDQLSQSARDVAAIAAVIGREFDLHVLFQTNYLDERSLVEGLDELLHSQIVRERSAKTYDFSHDKIRDVAYAGVSNARRVLLHRRVAEAMETIHSSDPGRVAGQLGAHYDYAGLIPKAVAYYRRAAEAAMQVYANTEAIKLFQRGLTLLRRLPQSTEQEKLELTILLGLGSATAATGGYGASGVGQAYHRAQELTRSLGYPPNPSIPRALGIWHLARREVANALKNGEELLTLAQRDGQSTDPLVYVESQYVLGAARFWMGEFETARQHFDQGYAAYDPLLHSEHVTRFWQDPGPVCLSRLGFSLWYVGYPDQAVDACDQAISLAYELGHPLTTAYALCFDIWLRLDRRERKVAGEKALGLIVYSEEYAMDYWVPMARAAQCRDQADRGDIGAGLSGIQAAIEAYRAAHNDLYRPYLLARLAEVYILAGAAGSALATVDEALASVDHHGDHWYDAELLRLKAEALLLQAAPSSIVERLFQQSLALARLQQAKSLELRAATSLARFWVRRGQVAGAHALLAPIYGWFSEGFDTADLKDARHLLDELA